MNQKHALVVSEIDFREWLINLNEPNVGNNNRSGNNRENGSLNVDHPCSDQTRLIAARIEWEFPCRNALELTNQMVTGRL